MGQHCRHGSGACPGGDEVPGVGVGREQGQAAVG